MLEARPGFCPDRRPEKCAYVRKQWDILEDGKTDKPLNVWVYFANRQNKPPLPNAEYKRLIVEGARHWCLPAEYIRQLEQIPTEG
ncbi:MAG: gamma-glutamylcyclotransferase [Acidobacteria bacterium]|nr:gamma-glutamylcyclotransferase [Acidobacteriota bacterium]